MKKIFILFLFVITSCGYQPLYKIDKIKNKVKFKEIELTGDPSLGKIIYSRLSIEIIENDESLDKLILNVQKNINETSKNSKGQATSYRTLILIKLSILDDKGNLVKEKKLSKQLSYNSKNNKFKLREYQIEIENDLINKIIEDINIYLKF